MTGQSEEAGRVMCQVQSFARSTPDNHSAAAFYLLGSQVSLLLRLQHNTILHIISCHAWAFLLVMETSFANRLANHFQIMEIAYIKQ